MFHQQGCHGRVLIGPLPAAVQARLAGLPGDWLEFDAAAGAVVVRHVQPTAAPCLPTIVSEVVRLLAAVPVEFHEHIGGGDLLVHTEDSPHVVRLRVEEGGGLRITWAHPCFANAPRQPYAGGRIAIDPVFCRLNGDVALSAPDPARAAKEIQRLADTFEGLYPEGEFQATGDKTQHRVRVHMHDANLDVRVLVERLLKIASHGSAEGTIEVSSFDERYPDDCIRVVLEKGQAWVEEPALFDEAPAVP